MSTLFYTTNISKNTSVLIRKFSESSQSQHYVKKSLRGIKSLVRRTELNRFVPGFVPLTVLEATGLLVVSVCPMDSGDQPLCLFLGGPVFAIDP